jgi:hypothetical protein
MRRSSTPRAALALAIIVQVCWLGGCGGKNFRSVWRDREVGIDGVPAEWQGTTTYIEDPNVAVGVMNDDDYLYVSLSTPVREVESQIVFRGLTVWFDPGGRKAKRFGIRCPVGMAMRPGEFGRRAEREGNRKAGRDMIPENLEASTTFLEILGPDEDDRITLATAETPGIEVALGHQDGRFVYELKVPLRTDESHPYAIGVENGRPIGIGFETPEPDREAMREAMGDSLAGGLPGEGWGEGPDGEGMRHGGTGPGGMGPGGPGARGTRRLPRPLEIWGRISLASEAD